MTAYSTWNLPLVKEKLLAGEIFTQADMLKATDGKAWRLGAAIHYLSHDKGWAIQRHQNADRTVSYYLSRAEIRRIKAEEQKRLEEAA